MNKKIVISAILCMGLGLVACNSESISSSEEDVSSSSEVHQHTLGTLQHDESTHYYVCSTCSEKVNVEYHTGGIATCTTLAVCSVCGASYGSLTEHNYSDWTYENEENHCRTCVDCTHVDHQAHIYNKEIASSTYLKTAGDCITPTVYYKSCKCGAFSVDNSDTFEVVGHDYQAVISTQLDEFENPINLLSPADCEHPAEYYEVCSKCGGCSEDTFTVGNPLGHTYEYHAEEATSYASGCGEHYECGRCDKIFTKEGEDYVEVQGETIFHSQLNDPDYSNSVDNPYLIANEYDLCALRDNVAKGTTDEPVTYTGCYFKMTSDITLTEEWTKPIGLNASTSVFKGIFDGDNHTISDLTITREPGCTALFGNAINATIKNLKLSNVNMSSTSTTAATAQRTAAVVGRAENVTIENVHVLSGVINGSQENGGICGATINGVVLTNCSNAATVNSTGNRNGGLIGHTYSGNATITDCINKGTVNAFAATGGLIGQARVGTVTINSSKNLGEINGKGEGVGGIVGWENDGTAKLYIYSSVNSGTIYNDSGNNGTGGFLGLNLESSYVYIENSTNTGDVSTNNAPYVGGFIGLIRLSKDPESGTKTACSTVKNCTDYGNITGKTGDTVGAIVGINRGKIIDCKIFVDVLVNGAAFVNAYGNQNNGGTTTGTQTIDE